MMDEPTIIQGRVLSGGDLELIRRLIREEPGLHRTALSKKVCQLWDWRDATGRIKDMACRTMLRKLERRGLLVLPASRHPNNNARRGLTSGRTSRTPMDIAPEPIHEELARLEPIQLTCARPRTSESALFDELLRRYHYLGYRTTIGQSMKYLAHDKSGRLLGCLLFGSAAWMAAPRDRWIGWTHPQRTANLIRMTNNTRFMILPWVRVPHLASRLLGLAARRLNVDWRKRYGHPIALLETFVDTSRFTGTCYRAAGWQCLGQTTGRTRQDKENRAHEASKLIFVRPLLPDWRRHLLGSASVAKADP
jgi:hypothetical protein